MLRAADGLNKLSPPVNLSHHTDSQDGMHCTHLVSMVTCCYGNWVGRDCVVGEAEGGEDRRDEERMKKTKNGKRKEKHDKGERSEVEDAPVSEHRGDPLVTTTMRCTSST